MHAQTIANELQLDVNDVAATIRLLDEGNTIPFIARYRKEITGGIDDENLRKLSDRLKYIRQLDERKSEVIASIESQNKLTDELATSIKLAETVQRVEDLYRPFRPKRTTRATLAKERGLEPLADWLMSRPTQSSTAKRNGETDSDDEHIVTEQATRYIDPEKSLPDIDTVLQGARDIIAERLSDDPDVREKVRQLGRRQGAMRSEAAKQPPDNLETGTYDTYNDFEVVFQSARPHQVLAINRGEKVGALKANVQLPVDASESILKQALIKGAINGLPHSQKPGITRSPADDHLELAAEDSWKRLLAPSVERELRNELTEMAERHAINIFAANLRALLLLPPLKGHIALGIDPGYRTGCKVAVVDETGMLLETAVIYPTPPAKKIREAEKTILRLLEKYKTTVIAIGNGTASRETEQFVADLLDKVNRPSLSYIIVDEAGASVYSASVVARREFPDLDVSERSAVSIARRLQDPLAELVKIDPKSIGVGQYQHDVDEKALSESLSGVVEGTVNEVGVDLNTASAELLTYVAGLTPTVAQNIVVHREQNGPFPTRSALNDVPRLGPKTFEQCAGFLRIPDGTRPLDRTPIHPESYGPAELLLNQLGFQVDDIVQINNGKSLRTTLERLSPQNLHELSVQIDIGLPTLKDIIQALKRPGRDPREDATGPELRQDVLTIDDLKEGMKLKGTVRNVVDFGAFVDIGVGQDGLIHISQLADRFVNHPLDIVSVGMVVDVSVISVDVKRQRIALSMKETIG